MLTASETNEAKNAQTIANSDVLNKSYLSVVYKKSFLNNLLAEKKDQYTLVGLLFKKLFSKEFKIAKLYYSSSKRKAFEQEVVPLNGSNFVQHYLNSTAKTSRFQKHSNMVEIDNNQQWKLKEPNEQTGIKDKSILQFWDVIDDVENKELDPLVFFSRYSLNFLTSQNVDRICISGANIDYGIGFYNFGSESVDKENATRYPTLKAEISIGSIGDSKNIPNVAVALPCPPGWGGVKNEQEVSTNTNLNTTFFSEVISNYLQYNEQTRTVGNFEEDNPRSVGQTTDFFGNLTENWNKFLLGNN